MDFETLCLHSGYQPKNGEPTALPIYQSTTYKYDDTDSVAGLFDLTVDGHMYSRISNPTVGFVEQKIAALEGGVGALCTTSGQAASLISLLTLLEAGDHVLSSSTIYGGTVNLFSVTLKKFGITIDYVLPDASADEIAAAIGPRTRAVFGETMANPAMNVFDIQKFAEVAHAKGIPLIIDNTFATPYLCRPFEWGADIVVHSTTKYLDGHAQTVGGVIVDSGNFDWAANGERFPGFVNPDDSYHGVVYTQQFGKAAFITKARVQMMRDLGCYPTAFAAFLINMGLETLPVRMDRICENGQKVAEYLATRPEISHIGFPGLPGDPYHELACKYLPRGCSGVICLDIAGGREQAVKFMNALRLARIEVHVADICTCVLHPASSTHRQLTDDQLVACGINPGTVRLSCGLESAADIIADVAQALDALSQ